MKFAFLSTTSKHDKDFIRLPDKKVFTSMCSNFLVTNLKYLKQIIDEYDHPDMYFLLDTEKKQEISLYDEANIPNKIDYKPNDLTMEAADLAILNYFKRDLRGKSIAVYGTGNIAFKLALRLSERNANIHLYGRSKKKVDVCFKALRQITFDSKVICKGDMETKVDCLVSFASAERVINENFINILNENALCLDGGIANFTETFIKLSLQSNYEVRRLDVRQSQEIMDGYINSRINSDFDNIIGRDTINNQPVVAGGIMGGNGEIIVDRISNPSRVIGVANGIGGVKDESELSDEEKSAIKKIQSIIK